MKLPNVIFVVIDTVRSDRVSGYGYGRETMPNFDTFAEDATVYRDAVSQAAWSIPAHASLLTGSYPSEHGGTSVGPIVRHRPYLPEVLSDAGYETYAISPNEYVRPGTGFGRGFDEFYTGTTSPFNGTPLPDWVTSAYAPVVNWGTRTPAVRLPIERRYNARQVAEPPVRGDDGTTEHSVVSHATDVVERADSPFFLFVNVIDAHLPRSPNPEYYDRFVDDDLDDVTVVPNERAHSVGEGMSERAIRKMSQLYDADLRTMDETLGELLAVFQRGGVLDDSLVVLVSDHGENLGEFGCIGHQNSLFESVVSVPLAISYPDGGPDEVTQQVETRRVYHTILEETGIVPSSDRSLVTGAGDEVARGEFFSPMVDIEEVLRSGRVEYDPSLMGECLSFTRTEGRKQLSFAGKQWTFTVPEWERS